MSLSTASITGLLESQTNMTIQKSLLSAASRVDDETAIELLGLLNSSDGSLSASDIISLIGSSDDSQELSSNSLSNLLAMDSLVTLFDSEDSQTSGIADYLSSVSEEYDASLSSYIEDNADLAIIAQANASSSSVLDMFS